MQIRLFTHNEIFCYRTCVILECFAFFSTFFVVSNMAYDKNTGFLLIKFLSHWRPDCPYGMPGNGFENWKSGPKEHVHKKIKKDRQIL